MLKFKSIINNIVQGIGSRKVIPRTIDISEDRIIDKLLAENNSNTFLLRHLGQIILLSIVALSFLYILVSMILFFVFDVILFEPRVYTTTNGTTVITQPCGIEQAFFIHNSANYWTNSGIDIVEGDRITLSYSGSFYSTLRDLADASKYSEVVKYDWSSVYRVENTPRSIVNYCSFNDSLAYIGSLLYRIGNNKETEKETNARQMNFSDGKFSFDAPCGGPLQISVNDIYISDTYMVKKMLKEEYFVFSKGQKKEIIKRLDFQEKLDSNRLVLMALVNSLDSISKSIDSICFQIDRIVSLVQWDAQLIWDNDTVRKMLKANPSVFNIDKKRGIIKRLDFQERMDSCRYSLSLLVNSLDSMFRYQFINEPKSYLISRINYHIIRQNKHEQWDYLQNGYNYNLGKFLEAPLLLPDSVIIYLSNYQKRISKDTQSIIDGIYSQIDSIVSLAQWDAEEIWYNDNIGELFVTVKIKRKNLNYANPINKLFAKLYRYFDEIWEKNPLYVVSILILCALAYLQFLIFYSLWKSFFCKSELTKIVSNLSKRIRIKIVSKNKTK